MTSNARSQWISLVILFTLTSLQQIANAGDLSWSGLYRVEGVQIKDSGLGPKSNKSYLLHHMILQPKIIAADGLTIFGRFDILNNADYPNSQLGQTFGHGPGDGVPVVDRRTTNNSNVLGQTEKDEMLAVTQLYAQWVQEFGALIVGRMPLQFGLGITHNAGLGAFDHWFDTRDAVAYKFILGNLFIMPMMAKMQEGVVDVEDDVDDYIVQVQYENPETELKLGAMFEWRYATTTGADSLANPSTSPSDLGGAGALVGRGYQHRLINLFVSENVGNVKVGVEAGLLSGKTAVKTVPGGQDVDLNGYGIAGDLNWVRPDNKWEYGLRIGLASGDDAGTENKYEGFVFDRNYDIALLMFNHPLGRGDFMRTYLTRTVANSPSNSVDEESVSNVFYVSPRFNDKIKDNLSWGGRLTYAVLGEEPFPGGNTSSNLGFELDLNLTYKPYERMTWITEVGALFPDEAWKGGSQNFENKFAYGIVTKAAISF